MTKFAKALIRARVFIERGDIMYICRALEYTGGERFIQRILDQLNWLITYEDWLLKHHRKVYSTMNDDDVQQGRLQWIDSMIKQEKSK